MVWTTYYFDADGEVYYDDDTGARRYVVPLSSSVVTYEVCGSTVRVHAGPDGSPGKTWWRSLADPVEGVTTADTETSQRPGESGSAS
jgi:hypothetical protein